jgi:hypothetical protein
MDPGATMPIYNILDLCLAARIHPTKTNSSTSISLRKIQTTRQHQNGHLIYPPPYRLSCRKQSATLHRNPSFAPCQARNITQSAACSSDDKGNAVVTLVSSKHRG